MFGTAVFGLRGLGTSPTPYSPRVAPGYTYVISNASGTQVRHVGDGVYRVSKTDVTSAYDSSAISGSFASGAFRLWVKPAQADKNMHVGINDNPTASNSETDLDWWIYFGVGIYAIYYPAGLWIGPNSYSVGDKIWLDRNSAGDNQARIGEDWATATILGTVPSSGGGYPSGAAYFDSSIYQPGGQFDASFYVPPSGAELVYGMMFG